MGLQRTMNGGEWWSRVQVPSWLTSQKRPETSGLFKRHAAWKGASLSWRDSICPKSLIVLRFVLGWHLLDLYDRLYRHEFCSDSKVTWDLAKSSAFFSRKRTLCPHSCFHLGSKRLSLWRSIHIWIRNWVNKEGTAAFHLQSWNV